MAESAIRGAIGFFDKLGVYDVVLPFLLIFTIVFAILERTKIFGTEKIGKEETTRKNLNSIAAFVIALLVVASSQIVAVINASIAKIVLLLVLSISFLILIGTFYGKGDEVALTGKWKTAGMIFMAVGILLIFANELGWLKPTYDYLTTHWDSSVVGSIILVIVIVWFVAFVSGGKEEPKTEKKEGS
jgi:hypothetical protein